MVCSNGNEGLSVPAFYEFFVCALSSLRTTKDRSCGGQLVGVLATFQLGVELTWKTDKTGTEARNLIRNIWVTPAALSLGALKSSKAHRHTRDQGKNPTTHSRPSLQIILSLPNDIQNIATPTVQNFAGWFAVISRMAAALTSMHLWKYLNKLGFSVMINVH